MGSLGSENNIYFHAKRKSVVLELVKGKEFAIQLQTLLQKPVQGHGPDSAEQLALQILRSFTQTLSELSSCTPSTESAAAQIAAVDLGGSVCSGESKNKKGVKDRRGCYKRRRTLDSWVTVSSTVEDGRAWRKYGQKDIMNSKYPRCYFRCTHKYEGCKATKQVQRIKDDPILYQITYFNHHTCSAQTLMTIPHLVTVDSNPVESNLISFQSKQDQYSEKPLIISLVKQEPKQETDQSTEDTARDYQWEEITGLDSIGYKPVFGPIISSSKEDVASGFHSSCESTSLHDLDYMEVNQLGDIDNFQYYFD